MQFRVLLLHPKQEKKNLGDLVVEIKLTCLYSIFLKDFWQSGKESYESWWLQGTAREGKFLIQLFLNRWKLIT